MLVPISPLAKCLGFLAQVELFLKFYLKRKGKGYDKSCTRWNFQLDYIQDLAPNSGKEGKVVERNSSKSLLMGLVLLSLFVGSPNFAAQVDQPLVRVINTLAFVNDGSYPDRLEEVAFSIQNLSDRPLYWLKLEIIVRNPARVIVHSDTTEINVKTYMGKPLAPGGVKQMEKHLFIRGYRTQGRSGSVEIKVIDFGFSP